MSQQLTLDERIAIAGNPIWKNIYCVEMVYKDTLSTHAIKNYGVHSVGDETIDRHTQNHLIELYLTINDMVEKYHLNLSVRFKNNSDVVAILAIIRGYMSVWKEYKDSYGLDERIPLQDLMKIDKFAMELSKNVYASMHSNQPAPHFKGLGMITRAGGSNQNTSPSICYYTSFKNVFLPDTPILSHKDKQPKLNFPRSSWT